MSICWKMAERVGIEPTDPRRVNGFQVGCPLQIGHFGLTPEHEYSDPA